MRHTKTKKLRKTAAPAQAAAIPASWLLTGNSGADSTHFVGTKDNHPLEIRVNATRALRIEPNSASPNIVGGSSGNSAAPGASGATIGGGGASGSGSAPNTVTGSYGTVGGGNWNRAGQHATVCGGYVNTASSYAASVGGGMLNTAGDLYSTVGGGYWNAAGGVISTVSGGDLNQVSGTVSTVGRGEKNVASGEVSVVGGGQNNIAKGVASTVPGGRLNLAEAEFSFAAGRRAKAKHPATFVWADGTDADFRSERKNQFRVRANGGARFDINTAEGRWVNIRDDGAKLINTSTGARLTTGGIWTNASDRELKENFVELDGREILERLKGLPITRWNYRAQDATVRHLGPTAQDFYAAFQLGEDDRHIGTVDTDGVALLARRCTGSACNSRPR